MTHFLSSITESLSILIAENYLKKSEWIPGHSVFYLTLDVEDMGGCRPLQSTMNCVDIGRDLASVFESLA